MWVREALLVLGAGLLVTSCTSLSGPDSGAITLTLDVEPTTVTVGGTMQIQVVARNDGEKPISVEGPSDCLLFIEVTDASLSNVRYDSNGACAGAVVREILGPGDQRAKLFTWDGRSNAGMRLPSGSYVMRGAVRTVGNAYRGPGLLITVE